MWMHLYQDLTLDDKQIVDLVNEYLILKKRQENDLKKIKELREEINRYCDKKGIERIFSEEGYLQRDRQIRTNYDFLKIKEILEPVGFWNEVLDPSLKKLKKIWSKLPEEIQKKIEKEAKEEKEFKSLKAVFKKIKRDKLH